MEVLVEVDELQRTAGDSDERGGGVPATSEELRRASAELEGAPTIEILRWARSRFGDGLVVASSMENWVLVDLAARVDEALEVVFIDTGFHFPETLEYLEDARAAYPLRFTTLDAGIPEHEVRCGTPGCCERRKVAPLAELLSARDAWATGLRRSDGGARGNAAITHADRRFGVVKVNPLATWGPADVAEYEAEHALPLHPLRRKGYLSIGCAPTTTLPLPGQGRRSGRWSDTTKTECGLHQ